jgi:hypothetical protein
MRSRDGIAAAVAALGLLGSPLGARPAAASADYTAANAGPLHERDVPISARPTLPPAGRSADSPRLSSFAIVAAANDSDEAPWSLGRRVGFGMMLAAPLLATGGLYHRAKTSAESGAISPTCTEACRARENLSGDRTRNHVDAMQWLLLGAGVATFAGGGLLFWLDGPKAANDTSPHAALRFGRDGRPSAVILGKF